MSADYCLDMEESSIRFEISNSPSTSSDDCLPTWPVAHLVEHRTSISKVTGSNPSRTKYIFLYLSGMFRHSQKHLIIILYVSSLSHYDLMKF